MPIKPAAPVATSALSLLQKRPAESNEGTSLKGLAALQAAKKQQTEVPPPSTGLSFLQNKRAIVEASPLDISPPKKLKSFEVNDENKPPVLLGTNKPPVSGGLAALAALKKSNQEAPQPVKKAEEPKKEDECNVQ